MFWRGVWGYLPANIVQGVVGFLAIVVFTRLLSPEDFGRYALAYSVFTLAHVAVFTWLEAAMARYWAAETPETGLADHFASLYRAAFWLSAAFIPLVILGLMLWPAEPAFRFALGVALIGVPVRSLAKLAQERFRASGEVARAAGLDMATVIGGFLIGVIFALAGLGGAAPLLGLLLAPLFALPFILPGELKHARGGRPDPARLRRYATFGYPIAASLILSLVLASTDRFLLAVFMDEAAVGAYHAGYSIANRTLDVMFIWLGAAGAPAMVMALERGGRTALQDAAREQAGLFVLIGLPAAVGVMLVARPLAEVLIGQDLRSAAALITPWIALGAALSGVTVYYFNQVFTLGHRTDRMLLTMAVPAVANVVLNLILIPRFGVLGAAWATAASFALGLLASILIGRTVMRLPIPWEALIRCGVACAVMAGVVSLIPALGGPVELIAKAAIGGAVYAAVALTVNAAGVRDTGRRLLTAYRTRGAEA